MTIHPLTRAMMRCEEIRRHWTSQPENQRPPIHDHAGSLAWWSRWFASHEKAHCDLLVSEALGASDDQRNAKTPETRS